MAEASARSTPAFPEIPEIVQFSGVDLDKARAVLNRFYYPVAVGSPDDTADFRLGVGVIQLGPLTVGHLSFATPVTLQVAELDAYHVSMPTHGRLHARHAGREVVAGPSSGVVFGPGSPVFTSRGANSAEVAVKVERKALEDELCGLLGHPVERPLGLPPKVDLSAGPGHSWSRLVRLMCDELEYDASLFAEPLMAERVRCTVVTGLLMSLPHNYRDELTGDAAAAPPRAIRRVVDVIQNEPERPFTVTDLARIANMSVRSLQEGFRRHLGTAPMTYLQQIRLVRAHEALRRADPARLTVAAIAHRWGFAHLGRFASAYRARFNESPFETLRATR
ncbi:AraC family transcriptional regulator [Actinoplanes sp. URMC 104]|uniref:AraC family transcriptional regulator n=1 Tax=Actinoplanes sp. URMC 104 TaxID=3423409 RepID=UPI003F192F95